MAKNKTPEEGTNPQKAFQYASAHVLRTDSVVVLQRPEKIISEKVADRLKRAIAKTDEAMGKHPKL